MARWKTVTLRLKIKIYQCTRVKTPTFDEIRTYLGLDLDAAGAVVVPDEPDEGWVVETKMFPLPSASGSRRPVPVPSWAAYRLGTIGWISTRSEIGFDLSAAFL